MTKTAKKQRVSGASRLAELTSMGEKIFTVQDVATIWKITNRQALRMLLARYVKRNVLHRVWRGLYSTVDPKEVDPLLLGIKALGRYAYISCETVLFSAGLINQRPTEITMVSNVSKRFSLLGQRYRSRKMNDGFLYDADGIITRNGIRMATPGRAKQDMNYFNPKKYYDAHK
jgi:predicted transcriptional regulator of viral defense system